MSGVIRDFRLVLAGDIFAKGVTALSLLLAVRYLSADQLSLFVYFGAIAAASYTFFNGFFNRQFIFDDSGTTIAEYQKAGVVATLVACLCVLGLSDLDHPVMALPTIFLAAMATNYELSRTALQKKSAFTLYAVLEVIRSIIFFVSTCIIIFSGIRSPAVAILTAQGVSYGLVLLAVPKESAERDSLALSTLQILRGMFRPASIGLLTYFILVGLFGQLPVLLYKPYATSFEYAQFGSAFRYYGLLVSISAAVNTVCLPRIALERQSSGRDVFMAMRSVFVLSCVLAGVATLAGLIAIPWVDGGAYPAAAHQFACLSLAIVVGVFVGPLSAIYLRADRLGMMIGSQIVAVLSAAVMIWANGGADYYWVALALPAGIFCQFVILVVGLRKAVRVRA